MMLRKTRYLLCVAGVVGLCFGVNSLRADLVTYNANDDFYANENSSAPSTTFGAWSIGYRTASSGITGSDLTAYNTRGAGSDGYFHQWYIGGSTYSLPLAEINMASTYRYPLSPREIGLLPSMTNGWGTDAALLNNSYNVLRWTAPGKGVISVTTDLSNNVGNANSDVHLVVDGVTMWNTIVNNTTPTDGAVTGLTVHAGDYVDLVVGNNGVNPPNPVGVYQTIGFTAVPEPSTVGILLSAVFGLLAYAWRRRK